MPKEVIMRKRILSFAVLALIVFLFSNPALAAGFNGKLAPLNPEFLKYRDEMSNRDARRAVSDTTFARKGIFPGPIDFSYLKGTKVDGSFFKFPFASIPDKFDLKEEGRVTPVLDQGGWGTCWAFASMESMESSLLSATGAARDFSEMALAWFMYSDESKEKPGYTANSEEGNNPIFDLGAGQILEQVSAMFSRGTGPLYHTDAPYPQLSTREEWVKYVPNPLPYGPARMRLKEAIRFTNVDDIKRGLMQYGGMLVVFATAGIDNEKGTSYSPVYVGPDHAVMLVGWDNSYPKENFKNESGEQPARDGAWRIQNSWGTEPGDQGYYWISYEDATIFNPGKEMSPGATAFLAEPIGKYDGIYFHDPLGMCNYFKTGSSIQRADMANVFVARRDEKVVEIGFLTANPNLEYEIQVYKDLEKGSGPESGKAVFSVPQKGSAAAVGYRSVTLNTPALLKKGERFAIEVTLLSTASSALPDGLYLPVEVALSGYSDKVRVLAGESYLKQGGAWTDTYYYTEEGESVPYNLCIKAFTAADESQKTDGGGSGCDSGIYGAGVLVWGVYVWTRKRV